MNTSDLPGEESMTASRPHLLIVDDDPDIRELVHDQLALEGYELSSASNVAEVRKILDRVAVDLIVLDLNLPDGDGLSLCRTLRAEGHEGAIIMVTARDSAIDRVLGLELGADDYLTKPFEPRELSARVKNLLRRHSRATASVTPAGARTAQFGHWRLDLIKRRLIAPDNSLVMLSSTEFEVLSRLIQTPNQPLSREKLLPSRAATAAFDRVIDNQISRLRQKLAITGDTELILTVRNQGYLLATPVHFL